MQNDELQDETAPSLGNYLASSGRLAFVRRSALRAFNGLPPEPRHNHAHLSVPSGGTEGNDDSFLPSISADGHYVAFESFASNLVPNDAKGRMDIFVHQWLGKVYLPLILKNY